MTPTRVRIRIKDPDPGMPGGFKLPTDWVTGTMVGASTGPYGEAAHYVRLDGLLELESAANELKYVPEGMRVSESKRSWMPWRRTSQGQRLCRTIRVGGAIRIPGTDGETPSRFVDGVIPKGTKVLVVRRSSGEELVYVEDPSVVRLDSDDSPRAYRLDEELRPSRVVTASHVHLIFTESQPSEIEVAELQRGLAKPLAERDFVYVGYAEIEAC